MRAERGHPVVSGHAGRTGAIPVGDVELHQGLAVLGDEGDGHHHERHAFAAGALDFVRDRGLKPRQRPHLALIAHPPVEPLVAQAGDDPPCRLLHLPLVGIAARHHLLGQPVGGEEEAGRTDLRCVHQQGFDQRRMCLHEPFHARVAADGPQRRDDVGVLRRRPPSCERRCRGRGRELRVERQQHDAIWPKGRHLLRRRLAHRVPVAHGDSDSDLAEIVQGTSEGRRLRLGLRKQRRAAADGAIDAPRLGPATARDQARDQVAHRRRRSDDRRVPEQVAQKGFDGAERIRPAEIEQDHGDTAHRASSPGHAPTMFESAATCSGGV